MKTIQPKTKIAAVVALLTFSAVLAAVNFDSLCQNPPRCFGAGAPVQIDPGCQPPHC